MAGLQYTKCYNMQYKAILHRKCKFAKIVDDHEHRNPKTCKIKKSTYSINKAIRYIMYGEITIFKMLQYTI